MASIHTLPTQLHSAAGSRTVLTRNIHTEPPVQQKTPIVCAHRQFYEEAERKHREKEQASECFLQQHLGTIRSWSKPETRQDPETGFKSVVQTSAPEPVAQSSVFAKAYDRLFTRKVGTSYDVETQLQKPSVVAELRI
jgi:hypothetical protein